MLTAPLIRFKAGDHICVFYRDEAYLLELLGSYIKQGLRNGERCFCAQKAEMTEQLKATLAFMGVDVIAEMRRGSLEIHTEREVYFPHGAFTSSALMQLLKTATIDAKKQGFTGLRTAGEMSWALNGLCDCDQLLEYETLVNQTFPDRPAIGMCQYDMRRFPQDVLESVLHQHRSALTQSGLTHSTFTIRHREYLADIVADRGAASRKFYYVAQPRDSKEILGWGAHATFDGAVLQAESLLGELASGAKHRCPHE
jgi:hypothetical protein